MISALNRQTLRSEIVSRMLEAIFAGKLATGDRLQERELAKQLGVSRTPLREAFLELDFLGIVNIQNYRGSIICRFGDTDLRDIYLIRGLLEAEATRLACLKLAPSAVDAWMRKMTEHLGRFTRESGWAEQSRDLDESFHDWLREESGSTRLKREIGRYRVLIYSIRKYLGAKYQFQASAVEEHIAVLEALKRRSPDEAAARMRHHVLKAGEYAVETMFQSPTPPLNSDTPCDSKTNDASLPAVLQE